MKFLEEVYKQYREQKENPTFEIEEIKLEENPKLNKLYEEITKKLEKEVPKEENKKEFEFGEVYYFLNEENIPIYFMLDGKIDDYNLYSVYKVSDFPEFATQKDFIFELNNLPYMVETWNEFYLTQEEIENALFIGKIEDNDLDILERVIDEGEQIPEEKNGVTIFEDGNYIQLKFQNDEVEDVKYYKLRIFQIFEEIEEKEEIEFLEDLLYRSLEEQENIQIPEIAYASEEETFAERDDFIMMKEGDELIIRVTDDSIVGKKGKIKIFGKTIEMEIPKEFKIKIPEKLSKVSIEYIADNLKIEA